MTDMIRMERVYFSYQNEKVLDNVSLTLHQGEFLALVGPNGSGKSTLVKLALGWLKPQAGEIQLMGQDIRRFRDRDKIGYVSQKANSFNLGFPATVFEVVATGLYGKMGLFRWMGRKEKQKVYEAIEQVGLSHLSHRNIGRLSGGQQQRAFIARALVSDPDLLILDEPTVGVDAESVERFYRLLTHLHREKKLTLLLVTHDIGAVTTYVDRIACLNKRIFFHGDPEEFTRKQKEILTAAYGHEVQLIDHQHETTEDKSLFVGT
ncbi:metal ABC transporter ATP-binding protein [Polycladomyces sp. WAk]|uniref:Metal ABC transporter ATP-binding protein n=1 Tax=Polycladomyces zharkentensis TaxID=2807616 RepID=A0ABS2WFJ6_9BACL|nr:metal ABC transporter ATP-binding protein [Polycladomyces sp. WAk]MBN2908204.1 metal ABC transporter ATP-binding protein [Polycladomyces sp. WAk]